MVNTCAWEVEIRGSDRAVFDARFDRWSKGPAAFNAGWISYQQVSRSRKAIRRSDSDMYGIFLLKSGQGQIEHCGRHLDLKAGDCAIVTNSEPYEATFSETDVVCLQIPTNWLRTQIVSPEDWRGLVLNQETATGAAFTATLLALEVQCREIPDIFSPDFLSPITGAIRLALGRAGGPRSHHARATYSRLKTYLERIAAEETFSVARMAAENGISQRYLHAIFAQFGTTILTELQRIRLDNARRTILTQNRPAMLTVTDVAFRSGFANSSHFARRFRERFGIAPGEAIRAPHRLEL